MATGHHPLRGHGGHRGPSVAAQVKLLREAGPEWELGAGQAMYAGSLEISLQNQHARALALRERERELDREPRLLFAQIRTGRDAYHEAAALVVSQDLVAQGQPFVMLTQRGNLYVRTAAAQPTLDQIKNIVSLAEVAAKGAKRVDQLLGEAATWPNTASSAWQPSTRSPEPEA